MPVVVYCFSHSAHWLPTENISVGIGEVLVKGEGRGERGEGIASKWKKREKRRTILNSSTIFFM